MRCYHSALVPKVVSKNLRLAVRFYSKKKWDAHILENIWKRIKLLLFFFPAFYSYEKRSLRATLLFGIIPAHVEMQGFE